MGYTHYWTQTRDLEDWDTVRDDVRAILKYAQDFAGIPLADGHGNQGSKPEVTDDKIWFNGVGPDDDHETMAIDRVGTADFTFCKTARKPYDPVVVACLCYLSTVALTHKVTSDGDGSELLPGLELARAALPKYANVLDLPMEVMKSDRWCAPWLSVNGGAYEANFCVDGCAYVTARGSPERHYRFNSHIEFARWLEAHKSATFKRGGDTGRFGGYGREEPNIWNATGSFDSARHDRIGKAQSKALSSLFATVDEAHNFPPPAFARPGAFPADRTFHYRFEDLLKAAEEAV
jgi:hypothetical protein